MGHQDIQILCSG